MIINPDRSELKKIVYLKTDIDKQPRFLTGYKVTVSDVTFELTCGVTVSWHYEYEFTDDIELIIPRVGFTR